MGTALPCAWAGAGTLAEYSVVGTGGTSTAAGLACRSRGSASGAARPLLGTRSTGWRLGVQRAAGDGWRRACSDGH